MQNGTLHCLNTLKHESIIKVLNVQRERYYTSRESATSLTDE